MFHSNVLHAAQRVLKPYRDRYSTIVGIHVRRGDRTNHAHNGPPPAAYFHQAVHWAQRRYTDVVVVVVCQPNSKTWCRSELSGIPMLPNGSPAVDLAVLASCDHVIISTGTFSWWGGWLSGGDVVYYKNELDWNWASYKQAPYFHKEWFALRSPPPSHS